MLRKQLWMKDRKEIKWRSNICEWKWNEKKSDLENFQKNVRIYLKKPNKKTEAEDETKLEKFMKKEMEWELKRSQEYCNMEWNGFGKDKELTGKF